MSEEWSDEWLNEQMAKLDKASYRLGQAYDCLKRIRDDRRVGFQSSYETKTIEDCVMKIDEGIKIATEVFEEIPYE